MPILKMDSQEFVDIWYGSRSWPVPAENSNMKTFTPNEDIIKTKADGRTELVARAGVPIPLAQAVKLGLVKLEPVEQQVIETKDGSNPENESTDTKTESKRGK